MAGPNIRFLGRQGFDQVRKHFQSAAAFVFPGIEDFGITPVEAQASGCPVIAFRGGGALETVTEDVTGLFFDDQTTESLEDAFLRFQSRSFHPQVCRENAERFSEDRFRSEYVQCVEQQLGRTVTSNLYATTAIGA